MPPPSGVNSRRTGIIRLIDFNRFGEIVSRRAGIIRLIDGVWFTGTADALGMGNPEGVDFDQK
jgi:hypothetical protein